MKKIFSIIVLIIISFFIGKGTPQSGIDVAMADTPPIDTGPPPIDAGCGTSSDSA